MNLGFVVVSRNLCRESDLCLFERQKDRAVGHALFVRGDLRLGNISLRRICGGTCEERHEVDAGERGAVGERNKIEPIGKSIELVEVPKRYDRGVSRHGEDYAAEPKMPGFPEIKGRTRNKTEKRDWRKERGKNEKSLRRRKYSSEIEEEKKREKP